MGETFDKELVKKKYPFPIATYFAKMQKEELLISKKKSSYQKLFLSMIDGMLCDVVALYEKTDCYNKVPEGEKEVDIWNYLTDKLLEIRKTIDMLFLGDKELQAKLIHIVDETEQFVRSYERPGVATR